MEGHIGYISWNAGKEQSLGLSKNPEKDFFASKSAGPEFWLRENGECPLPFPSFDKFANPGDIDLDIDLNKVFCEKKGK